MPSEIRRRTRQLFLLVAVVPVLLALGVWWSMFQVRNRNQWVVHTGEVLTGIESLTGSLKDSELGYRDYLISRDQAYLVNFAAGAASIDRKLRELRSLTADNPRQQANLDRLEPLVRKRIADLRQQIHPGQGGDSRGTASGLIRSEAGLAPDGELNALAAAMRAEEAGLMTERVIRQRRAEAILSCCLAWALPPRWVCFSGPAGCWNGTQRSATKQKPQ